MAFSGVGNPKAVATLAMVNAAKDVDNWNAKKARILKKIPAKKPPERRERERESHIHEAFVCSTCSRSDFKKYLFLQQWHRTETESRLLQEPHPLLLSTHRFPSLFEL